MRRTFMDTKWIAIGFRYSHDELFPALAIEIPYYLLPRPAELR
jgi:hypothetical protein